MGKMDRDSFWTGFLIGWILAIVLLVIFSKIPYS